jgi:hypothetical protein
MPKFDELNQKRGVAQYYSEALKAIDIAMNVSSFLAPKGQPITAP